MLCGEYGKSTSAATDHDPDVQEVYRRILIATVAESTGEPSCAVKAWWCGSRVFNRQLKNNPKARTWAMFSDDSPTGKAECKYTPMSLPVPVPWS